MNFQTLQKIENYKFYLDLAIVRGKERAEELSDHGTKEVRIDRIKRIELERIGTVRNVLVEKFQHILKSYPQFDDLPDFYRELVRCTLEYDILKKSLGTIQWTAAKVTGFHSIYSRKIKMARTYEDVMLHKKEFYGRISSVMKQINDYLTYLEECRKILKEFPTIKTSLKTHALIGFPNVGKTTLLFKLTGSKPEIKNYAFTTKNINVSYLTHSGEKIQILDTPGTLNRFNKMNNVERQSYLALKYVADKIILVVDGTGQYPLSEQVKLYHSLEEYQKDMVVYLSKTDILKSDDIEMLKKKFSHAVCTNVDELTKAVFG